MALKGDLYIAGPSSDAQVQDIGARLAKLIGQEVSLRVKRDDKLIGGFKAMVDGKVYDSSILARMKDIQRHLFERE